MTMTMIETPEWQLEVAGRDIPIAIHRSTGRVYWLLYNSDWADDDPRIDDDLSHYSQDWSSSPLDGHWYNPVELTAALRWLYDCHLLRVDGAIYLPGADELGTIIA